MRSFLILFGVLLLPLPAFALSDSITNYCRSTNNPEACISSFIANEPYAKELAEFERRYAKEVADEKALDQSRKATSQQSDPRIDYCMTTRHPQDCIDSLQMDLRARQSEDDLSAGQRERAHQRDMQERQIEAQQDLAREQSRGMALFGSGQALINGMNQGFQNMQQPRYAPAPFVPIMPMNPVQPTIRCYSTNPGAMQTTTCY